MIQISLEEKFPRILDFFSGFFVGIGFIGGISCFFVLNLFYPTVFVLLISLGVFCVFVFFGLISKSLSILLKKNTKDSL